MSCNMHHNPDVRRWMKATKRYLGRHILAIDPEMPADRGINFRTIKKARTYKRSHPNVELYRLDIHRGQQGYFFTK